VTEAYKAKRHYQRQDVAKGYDAERFRSLRGRLVNSLERRLLMQSIAGLPAGALVLDLPTGTGRMARWLADEGYRVLGADISLPMLDESRRQSDAATLVRAEGERLPLAAESVDAAICFRLMSHLPREARVAVLREMGRVARVRVVAVFQPHRIAVWWLVYGLLLRKPLPRFYVSTTGLKREFADSGLRVVRSHSLLRGLLMERAYVLAPT
jgi:ubiquinone/menaquinone biosynthesis C-methylase UbiE